MSDWFPDTEIQDDTHEAVVRAIDASGLSLAQAEAAFGNGVYRVLWSNLACSAGVWDDVDRLWLLCTLNVCCASNPRRRWFPFIAKEMRKEWARVTAAYQTTQATCEERAR